jgi:hypothetical protein
MNRIMRDLVSIIESSCEIMWNCIVDTSTQVYSILKTSDVQNDNKRIENSSNERVEKYGHDMGGNYQYGVDTHDYDPRIDPKYDHHSHIPRCNDDASYDENSNDEVSYNEVSYDDDQNENNWRDRFAGWLP